jgi:hypothetical protein
MEYEERTTGCHEELLEGRDDLKGGRREYIPPRAVWQSAKMESLANGLARIDQPIDECR